ncbi:MAG TPA: hypothetical protein VF409_06025 [Sphingomonas sp.]
MTAAPGPGSSTQALQTYEKGFDMEHPLFPRKLDHAIVRGEFKRAGSTDIDVLSSVRSRLIATQNTAKMAGAGFIAIGILLGLTIIMLPANLITLPMGLYIRSRPKQNIRVINEVFEEFQRNADGRALAS